MGNSILSTLSVISQSTLHLSTFASTLMRPLYLLRCPQVISSIFTTSSKLPAFLKVGDVLLGTESNGAALEITKIDTIVKKGAFAPLTVDGTIAVNGVVASSYVFQTWYQGDNVYFLGRYKIMPHNGFSHMKHSPLRLASLGISPRLGTFADEEGRNFLTCAFAKAGTWMHSKKKLNIDLTYYRGARI